MMVISGADDGDTTVLGVPLFISISGRKIIWGAKRSPEAHCSKPGGSTEPSWVREMEQLVIHTFVQSS